MKMALLSRIPCSALPVVHDMPDQIAKTVGALLVGSDGKVLLGLRAVENGMAVISGYDRRPCGT